MIIIRAKEGNNTLSWVLRKNPDTCKEKGGFKEIIGTGTYWGYYESPKEFRLIFIPKRDREEPGSIEQFPINHITDPDILKGLISQLLRSAWKEPLDIDGEIEIEFFLFTPKSLKGFDVNVISSLHQAYRVCQSFPSLYEGLNWLLALTYYLKSSKTSLVKDDCEKAALNCNNAGLGYYPRYLISNTTPYASLFNTPYINIKGGSVYQQRRRYICEELKKNKSSDKVVYIGNDGLYTLKKLIGIYKEIIVILNEEGGDNKYRELGVKVLTSRDYSEVRDKDVVLGEGRTSIVDEVLEHYPHRVLMCIFNKEFFHTYIQGEETIDEESVSILSEDYSINQTSVGDEVTSPLGVISSMSLINIERRK